VSISLSITESVAPAFDLVVVDLYRDIHKGIRAELFAVTSKAGSLDPSNRMDRAALVDHVEALAGILESHAHHEDEAIEPPLLEHLPELAERIGADHHRLESHFGAIVDLSTGFADVAAVDERRLGHQLYLELSAFTSTYLEHQLVEERVVMPALERAIGWEAALDIHQAIVGSIPPDEMAMSLAFMLPAMNVADRAELLGGVRQSAPPEVFAGVMSLAQSVLEPADFTATQARLEQG
jgi:hypothetical protein